MQFPLIFEFINLKYKQTNRSSNNKKQTGQKRLKIYLETQRILDRPPPPKKNPKRNENTFTKIGIK